MDIFRKNHLISDDVVGSVGIIDTQLNINLIQTPKECVEYVVIHELCHLVHHNHGPEFYKLLEHTLPDWIQRKHKLELSLI